MRRRWLRLLCRLGWHDWRYSTLTDIDPEQCEVQECARCHLYRGRERSLVGVWWTGTRLVGWTPWETFTPCPEPPMGALD